jgi:outer membrane protein assembly factor BamB
VIWNVDTKHAISNSSPTISNGVVYVGTDDGYILAFAESDGTLLWTSPQMTLYSGKPDPILAPPVISVNRIHVTTQSGALYVYGLAGF